MLSTQKLQEHHADTVILTLQNELNYYIGQGNYSSYYDILDLCSNPQLKDILTQKNDKFIAALLSAEPRFLVAFVALDFTNLDQPVDGDTILSRMCVDPRKYHSELQHILETKQMKLSPEQRDLLGRTLDAFAKDSMERNILDDLAPAMEANLLLADAATDEDVEVTKVEQPTAKVGIGYSLNRPKNAQTKSKKDDLYRYVLIKNFNAQFLRPTTTSKQNQSTPEDGEQFKYEFVGP